MIKTAIIGASGFIGRHLWDTYNKIFPETVGTAFSTQNSDLAFFDIRQPDISSLRLPEQGYQAVIITAAKSNIGFCEGQPEAAYAVNVQGTLELIRQIEKASLKTIFLSTDYVFEGTSGNYEDDSPTLPTTEYGRQKAMVERVIPSLTNDFLILRIGKIYGVEKDDKTLLDETACLLASGQAVQCAKDQFFCPTLIHDLTAAILHIQSEKVTGIFNLCSAETWSRYEIAHSLAGAMNVDPILVKQIALYDIPSMVGRPLNTTMKCSSPRIVEMQRGFTPLSQSIKMVASNYHGASLRVYEHRKA